VLNDALTGGDAQWTNLTEPRGGLMFRPHGKGLIIFCQLEVLHRYRDAAGAQLIRNILNFAAAGRKSPRLVLLDGGHADKALDHLKIRHLWLDELPLKR